MAVLFGGLWYRCMGCGWRDKVAPDHNHKCPNCRKQTTLDPYEGK